MKKTKSTTIEVHGTAVTILSDKQGDYISLTDMLRAKDGSSSSVFGNPFSTLVLIMANSPQLKVRPA